MVQEEVTRGSKNGKCLIHPLHTLWDKFSELSPGLGAGTWW